MQCLAAHNIMIYILRDTSVKFKKLVIVLVNPQKSHP